MTTAKSFEYPELTTERLQLKLLALQDAEEVLRHFADEDITRFMDIEPITSLEEAREIIRYHLEDTGCRWGIYEQATQSFIGTCGFHYIRNADERWSAEIGFDLAKNFWGKGYMSEAVNAVVGFGFETMTLDVIDATVEPENSKSLRLLEKLGFMREQELQKGLVYFYKYR